MGSGGFGHSLPSLGLIADIKADAGGARCSDWCDVADIERGVFPEGEAGGKAGTAEGDVANGRLVCGEIGIAREDQDGASGGDPGR